MLAPILAIIATLAVITIGSITPLNIGILGLVSSFIVAMVSGMAVSTLTGLFPVSIFMSIFGVSYLFQTATKNGTLDILVRAIVKLVRGKRSLIPWVYFFASTAISAIGPGGVGACAILAPTAMMTAYTFNINPLMLAALGVHGSHAGSFSPISNMGVGIYAALESYGFENNFVQSVFTNGIIVNLLFALVVYLIFGGVKLLRQDFGKNRSVQKTTVEASNTEAIGPINIHQKLTMLAMVVLIIGIVALGTDAGYTAILLGFFLNALARGKKEKDIIKDLPWDTIVMLIGMMTLVGLLDATGATDMIVEAALSIASPLVTQLLLILACAVISAYASSLSAILIFIPMIPTLIEMAGPSVTIDVPGLVSALCIAGCVVDVSPLSTLGALYCANVVGVDKRVFFKKLMAYGLIMIPVGSLFAWLLFVVL